MGITQSITKYLADMFSLRSGQAQKLIEGVYTYSNTTAPKKGTSDYLKAFSTHPWLRAAESKIGDGVASVQWKLLAIKKGNKLAKVSKIMSLGDAVTGGGYWYQHHGIQHAPKYARQQYIKEAQAQGELVEILDHPMLTALTSMNAFFTGYQVRKLITIYIDIIGEAPLLKERSAQGVTVGLWPIPPHWVTDVPKPADPNFHIQFGGAGVKSLVPMQDILWMVDADPFNPYGRGSGHVMAMGDELDLHEFMTKYQRAFFFNSARPEFIVELDGMSPETTQRMEQGWNSQHQGFWKAFKAHFINKAIKLHTIQGSFKDQQMGAMTNMVRDHIAQIIGIPPEKLGIIESSNRATSEAADVTFTKDVISPRAEFQRQFFQEKLLPEYDPRLIIEYDSPVPSDKEQELNAAKAQPHVLSVDEWRELTGHGALPDEEGKVYIIQGQPKVIESFADLADMQEEDRDLARDQFGFGDSNNEDSMDETVEEEMEEDGEDDDKWEHLTVTKKDEPSSSRSFRSPSFFGKSFPVGTICHKTLFAESEDIPSDIEYTDVHRLADRFYGPLRRNILRNFEEIKKHIDMDKLVKLLTMQEPSESVMDAIPLNMLQGFKAVTENSDLKAFIRLTLSTLAGVSAETAVHRLAIALGQDLRFANMDADAIAWAGQYAANLVRNISAYTKEALKDIIITSYEQSIPPVETAKLIKTIVGLDPKRAKAVKKFAIKLLDSGMDIDKLAARVERYAQAHIRKRAMTIARTETINASNMGQQIAWDRAVTEGVINPDKMVKIWITTPDDRLDTIVCEPMPTMAENQNLKINERFTTGDGKMIKQPTAHPNCRCTTGLVMKGK